VKVYFGSWLVVLIACILSCSCLESKTSEPHCIDIMSTNTMKAIDLKEYGSSEQLYITPLPRPSINKDELLIRVKATAINRADIMQRSGKYPPPPGASRILGLEMAGTVEEVGSEVRAEDWKIGDRVMALLSGGGYAQYTAINQKMAIRIPDEMDFETAAAIPEAFLTAYQTLFTIGNLEAGQRVLVHAGASGVGTSAIQLCNLVEGVEVFVTAGSDVKIQECLKLGAKGGANYKEEDWAAKLQPLTGGVDLVIDCVGASYFEKNLQILKMDGKLVMIGMLSGSTLHDSLQLAPILYKRLTIQGTTLRSRSEEYKINLTQSFVRFTEGKLGTSLKPVISKVFNWEDVAEAHQFMEKDQNIGKIVLQIH